MADAAIDLCPACGYREADTEEGFCTTCSGRRQLALYEAKDRQDAEKRNERWREWSSSPEAMVARQRRSRLLRQTKPEQRAAPDTDPLEIGKEVLDKLHRVRQALGANVAGRAYLEEATELVKQLAWGPPEEDRPSVPEPAFDTSTPSGRGRLGQHRRWHASGKRPCTCRPGP
jgi:hypothetical protein